MFFDYNIGAYHAPEASTYLAAPLSTYRTAGYDRALAACRQRWPDAEILSPRELFADRDEWLARWPALLANLGGLAFICAADGFIGAGVAKEIADAEATGVPVWHLTADGHVLPRAGVQIRVVGLDMQRYATVAVEPDTAASGQSFASERQYRRVARRGRGVSQ